MRDRTHQVRGISLRELLPEAEIVGADDIRVSSCCADSRRCRPGDLFIALPGTLRDGHDFVTDAMRRGASAILADRPTPGCSLPTCYVDEPLKAYGELCQALAGYPSRRLKVIGITGTNGKTTTTYLVASILKAAGYLPGVLGTLGYCDGLEVGRADWTTPPAAVLASWMARLVNNGCTHAVMEVSSHALSQARVAGVQFDVAGVTNVRHDHLDYHGSAANYRAAKGKLFDYLLPEGFAIINADDEASEGFLARLDGPVLTVGIDSAAEISATMLEQFISEQTFLLHVDSETVPVRTRMIGRHNVYNCMMATAVGLAYGIDLSTIVRGLESVDHLPGRLERLECGQQFGVFVDYAHTPDALAGSLDTLRSVTPGRLICVFGAGGDRDRAKRPWMGQAVSARADVVVVTSDNPRGEQPRKIIGEIVGGIRNPSSVRVILDREQAINWALGEARPGDCVLIAGKGHEDYQLIGNEKIDFDDREIACKWLYESASATDELYRAA
jgi:UDP-N-acetylmuramoyl-L-alanyl-D-glutamate--2,6-diaminopimelate ligase